jgi:UDP-2,3-diacylglucosamine hydrolase
MGIKIIKKQPFNFVTLHLDPLPQHKKLFFASDFHLGAPSYITSRVREKEIVRWLDSIQPEAHALFLLGDIFDYWFEYKHVIPKGFTRLKGKLASFTDQHIPVYFFAGNHEIGLNDYLTQELNITILKKPASITIGDKKLLVGHGDELGSSKSYNLIKKLVYTNPVFQWIFQKIHPDIGVPLAGWISHQSRKQPIQKQLQIDPILKFCKDHIEPYNHHDFYVFGHLHIPYQAMLHPCSHYYNIGDWVQHNTYGAFDGKQFEVLRFC